VTIAFDGICLGDGPATGVGRSFLNALQAYADRGEAECVLLLPKDVTMQPIASVRLVEAPRGAWQRQRQLPRILRTVNARLLHSSVASVPLYTPCPTIATAHDLPWLHRELDEPGSAWRQFATRRALRSAARIIAPSTMTKRDIAMLLGKRCPPIELVMHGTARGPGPTEASTTARDGAFLVLGDDRKRKNRARLQAAHQLARAQHDDLPDLCFCGPPDHYVDEAEKLALLQSCRALVHVSHFEGFGMPVLEGLANGAPVVCSDLPPHREIADLGKNGELALFVDPQSIDSIADALARIHLDSELRWRLALAGHQRARDLTPQATAEQWSRIHREVLV
jgi:hypothetical protein